MLYSVRLDGAEQRWILDWNPRGGRLRFRAINETDEGTAFEVTDRVSFNLFGAPRGREAEEGRRQSGWA